MPRSLTPRRSPRSTTLPRGAALAALLAAAPAALADAYIAVPLADLALDDYSLPERGGANFGYGSWHAPRWPYLVLDGPGEAYIAQPRDPDQWASAAWFRYDEAQVGMHLPDEPGDVVAGTLFIKDWERSAMRPVAFTLDLGGVETDAEAAYLQVKENHYRTLLLQPIPGAAHFRHEMNQARRARLKLLSEDADAPVQVQAAQNYENDLQKSFAFVTGGRALAENLPLDADLQVEAEQSLTVDIKSLEGITVPEVDWSAILPDEKPRLDALAAHIPADQYACFFPSFGALLRVVDEAERMGAPILEIAQPRAQDAHVRERYERQLCLQIDELTRQLGPALITSVAVTGSDPYFPTGTDVAVLFETRTPELLLQTLRAKQNLALQREPGAEQTNVEVAGRLFGGVASPGRRICSYLFQLDGIVVVTNSPHQIRRLLDVERGEDALADLDEFAYFRGEYPLGEADESAFLVATDAAIRRWASATWRIGTSRRTRAAAELADLVAAHDAALLRDEITPAALSQPLDVPGSHGLRLTETGPVDSVYGSLHFLTPIAELSIDSVTEAEASAYSRFRRSYMQRWGQGFDPIAARLSVEPRRLGLSLTVVPLTVRSQYRSLMEVTGDTRLPAEAGDPHREAVLHATLALDPDSEPVRYANNFMRMINPEGTAPLTKWLGGWLTVYVDDDPVFDAALASDDPQEYLQERLFETPLAVEVEITSLSRATIFLAALRTYLDQVAPKALLWEPKEHGDASYVEISFREESGGQIAEQLHVYYHLTSGSLTASLSEEVLKRAIERKAAKGQAANEPAASNADQRAATLLGESMRLNAGRRAIDAIRAISNDSYTSTMQRRAWANLPILNEYRRLFPRRDPVEVYEELWGATLICPGGGEFVWDQTFHTMRSTVFGHPGEPLAAEDYPPVIREIERADFGLTFEHDGLQARLVIHREDAAEQ